MQIEKDEEITIGNGSPHSIKGIVTCTIKLKLVKSSHLSGVLYVPSIKRNSISISTLEDHGYRVTFMEIKVLAFENNSTIKKTQTIGLSQGL